MIHLVCPNPAIDRTLLFQGLKEGIPNRPTEIREFPGGKSFNVAYSLNFEKKQDFLIHTILGGLYGDKLAKLAKEQNYPLAINKSLEETRLCSILVDQPTHTIMPIYEKGQPLTDHVLSKLTEQMISQVQTDDFLVFSGSFMLGMPTDYIHHLETEFAKQGKKIKLCIDSSGAALKDTYSQATPFLIKINDEEIRDIFPDEQLEKKADFLRLLKTKIRPDIAHFIITLGKDGIIGRLDGQYYHGWAEPIQAKNPIACGDFFLGRLIKGLADKQTPEAILTDALLFSTCNALNWFPEVTTQQLAQYRETITVESLPD